MSTDTKGWQLEGENWVAAGSLPLTDRGLRYGMSVFETIGVRDGQPLLFEKHAHLLATSAKELLGAGVKLAIPPLDPGDRGMLRFYVTAGDGGPGAPVKEPRIFALYEALSGDLPAFGWSPYAERVNGRFAMVGFVAVLVVEALSHQSFLAWAGLLPTA